MKPSGSRADGTEHSEQRDLRKAEWSALRSDPELSSRRARPDAIKLGAVLGLVIGVIPAALFLEFAPHLGLLRPAIWSFGGTILLFVLLSRARHRAVVWVAAGGISLLLIIGAVIAVIYTITQTIEPLTAAA